MREDFSSNTSTVPDAMETRVHGERTANRCRKRQRAEHGWKTAHATNSLNTYTVMLWPKTL